MVLVILLLLFIILSVNNYIKLSSNRDKINGQQEQIEKLENENTKIKELLSYIKEN